MNEENKSVIYYDTKTGRILNNELEKAFENGVSRDTHIATGVGIQTNGSQNPPAPEIPVRKTNSNGLPGNDDPIIRAVHNHSKQFRLEQEIANAIPTREPSRPAQSTFSTPEPTVEPQKKKIPSNPSRERYYYEAQQNSCRKDAQPIKRNPANKTKVAKTVIALSLVAAMSIAGYKLVDKAVTNVTNDIHYSEASQAASKIVTGYDKAPNIVSNNTHRTSDYQNYWFDNIGIAKDLLRLPDQAFLAGLTTVYIQMGSNAVNSYIDNFGRVVREVGYLADPTEHPHAYAYCHDASNSNEFLQNNNFVNEDGEPSFKEFLKFGQEEINRNLDYLKQYASNINTELETEESFGGRK